MKTMKRILKIKERFKLGNEGMEMVQVAILIAIAVIAGLIFKQEISSFVNKTFMDLNSGF